MAASAEERAHRHADSASKGASAERGLTDTQMVSTRVQ